MAVWFMWAAKFMVNYHYVKYQKKTNDVILRKRSDGQTDEGDFIVRCPTGVEPCKRSCKKIFEIRNQAFMFCLV